MSLELDAEHVEALALHPVRTAIHGHQRGTGRHASAELRFQHELRVGVQVIDARDDLERLVPLRRGELLHQLAMTTQPGLAPLPALVDQVIDSKPAPPPPPPPPVEAPKPEPPPPPPPAKPAKKGGKKGGKGKKR